jgi:hypothetical protein
VSRGDSFIKSELGTGAICYRATPRMIEEFTRLEVVSPWGERLILKLTPPKPNLPIDPDPYYFIKDRCAWEDCNRLFSLSERGSRIYCSDECQEAAKRHRAKLRRAGLTMER